MSPLELIVIIAIGWIVLVVLIRGIAIPWLERGAGGSAFYGILWRLTRIYCRLLHRPLYHGERALRRQMNPGGLIVLSNHTSALDPLLIQSACHFRIRWMMASDMMNREFDWFWKSMEIIPVSRDGRDAAALREAIRHARSGGVLGVFPEGRIVTRGEIRPFLPGVGMIAARAKVPVVLVWVTGTPNTQRMGTAFFTPSHARVEFIEVMQFDDDADPKSITQRARERLAEASGWPLNDQPMTPEEEEASSAYRSDRSSASTAHS